jgi:enoyl-CoA hydratase/carnithine racemase
MSAGPLRVERAPNGVVVLTLAMPDRRNAMTAEMTQAWSQALAGLQGDRTVRAVVVTGEGSAFTSGGDLGWIEAANELSVDLIRDRMVPFYRAWLAVRDLEVPTIAAVNGPAVGAGLCLALACDLRYIASTATMSAPFTALGIHAGMAATFLLPETVGLPVARELLLTGRRVGAAEALRLGLVNGVFEPDALVAGVRSVADQIAANAPIAVRLTVAGLREGGHESLEAALRYEALAQPVTFATADLVEGVTAARERRLPVFTGR